MMTSAKFTQRLSKAGKLFYFRVPTSFIQTQVLVKGKKYRIELEEVWEYDRRSIRGK